MSKVNGINNEQSWHLKLRLRPQARFCPSLKRLLSLLSRQA